MNNTYIPLHAYPGRWMFSDETIPIPDEDLAFINPLHPSYSTAIWGRLVTPQHDHLMLLTPSEDEQVFGSREAGQTFWYEQDWTTNTTERISNVLHASIPWSPHMVVYFFWSAGHGIETTWRVFVRHWLNFLFEDEAAILVSKATAHVAIFSLGKLWIRTHLHSDGY